MLGRISWIDGVDVAYQRKAPTQRIGIFIFVVLLHALLIHGLVSRLTRQKIEVIPRPIEVRIIKEMAPMPMETPPAPSPPRQLKPVLKPAPKPRPSVPPPKVRIRKPSPSPQAPTAATSITPAPVPPSPAPAPTPPGPAQEPEPSVQAPVASVETAPALHVPVRTAPRVDSRLCNKPEYPSASRRLEETGTVVLNFLIDADGHVIQSRIESSSGYQRLDEAARQALSLCRFKPGTVDGKPEKSWHRLKYVWKLENE